MSEKKYSPREAAIAVLKKAEELYRTTAFIKGEDPLNPIAGDRIKRGIGYKERGEDLSHKIAMDGAKDAHKERLEGIKEAPKPNLDKAEEAPMKGHIKLAKFIGRMESKKASKSNELDKTEHEKGINPPANLQVNRPGVSSAGISTRSAKINKDKGASSWQNVNEAKDRHKKVLGQMKDIKPKLPA